MFQSSFLGVLGCAGVAAAGGFQWSVPYCRRGLRHAASKLTKSADLTNGGVSASATVGGIKTFIDPLAKIKNPLEPEEQ
jgi:hypothetical protein